MGITQYGDLHTTICSGAWDWKYDGCITETGWVADLVSSGIPLDQLKCQSNSARMHEQFQTMLTFDPVANKCTNSLGSTARYVDGQPTDNLCRELRLIPAPQDRVGRLAKLIEDGYNTNYVTTWLMVRSEPKLLNTGALAGDVTGCPASLASRTSTVGPLNKNRIGNASISSTVVPLLACAQVGDTRTGILGEDIADYPQGIRLAAGMTSGPIDPDTMKIPVTGSGSGYSSWGPYWKKALQDYRNFSPVHGGSCNVLFLDLSVKNFNDTNRDGMLNNGFKASSNNSFVDDTVELPHALIYSGWTLNPSRISQQ
jgi:prepilin-type processing-associated H-X9-DG protein